MSGRPKAIRSRSPFSSATSAVFRFNRPVAMSTLRKKLWNFVAMPSGIAVSPEGELVAQVYVS